MKYINPLACWFWNDRVMSIKHKKGMSMSVDCRLVVILEDSSTPHLEEMFNQLISTYRQIGGFTFVSGTNKDITLKLTHPWADTIFNANEFLDFHSFASSYMDQFQEILFLKEESLKTFRLDEHNENLRRLG
jgi:hypothetical protein